MPISESQLEIWSHQGSVTQSSETYNAVKRVLESANAAYAGKNYKVFLQGSYGNSTNVYKESDVDIVIRLDDCYTYDTAMLSESERRDLNSSMTPAAYNYWNFKYDVLAALTNQYGSDVEIGEKAITIKANGNRRRTDIITALQHRRYIRYSSELSQNYIEGISFYSKSFEHIVNFPKQHLANLVTKHQNTSQNFKPMARILKNIRNKLVEDKVLAREIAPSYFIEGLLYNVPDVLFNSSYQSNLIMVLYWLNNVDKSKFLCANEQYFLLNGNASVTWNIEHCNLFLQNVSKFCE